MPFRFSRYALVTHRLRPALLVLLASCLYVQVAGCLLLVESTTCIVLLCCTYITVVSSLLFFVSSQHRHRCRLQHAQRAPVFSRWVESSLQSGITHHHPNACNKRLLSKGRRKSSFKRL